MPLLTPEALPRAQAEQARVQAAGAPGGDQAQQQQQQQQQQPEQAPGASVIDANPFEDSLL